MEKIVWSELLKNAAKICIVGHVKPDGDCIGSCLGLRNYLFDCFPDLHVDVYLETYRDVYQYMRFAEEVLHEETPKCVYDLGIALDCSEGRIGAGKGCFASAGKTVCIDHHISNVGFADVNLILPHASSTAEVLCGLFEMEKISKETAECLYTGISHDTGIFKYSNTSGRTMRIAADLMEKGVDFTRILNETILEQEYRKNRFFGFCLYQSQRILDGFCIWSSVSREQMEQMGVSDRDTSGIVEKLRDTKGADCAFFLYETEPNLYRVSMRSKGKIDVSRICGQFGGGGHVQAAGCSIAGTPEQIAAMVSEEIKKQML